MPLEINNWSTSAGSNNFAPPDGAPESTTKLSQLNNIIREIMAVIARWSKDTNAGALITGGTPSAFTVTMNRSLPAYYDGFTVRFRNHLSNQANPTLSVNGLAPKFIVDSDSQVLPAAALDGRQSEVTYVAAFDRFMLNNYRSEKIMPVGCVTVFIQPTAPLHWTQLIIGDILIRLVNDASGGTSGGSWFISGLSTESTAHTHHYGPALTGVPNAAIPGPQGTGQGVAPQGHFHAIEGDTGPQSVLHSHVGDGSWRPAYINAIACQRNS